MPAGQARSRPRILPTAAPAPGADPPATRVGGGGLAGGPTLGRPRADRALALGQVVDHRRRDDRHDPRRGRVAAPVLLQPGHDAVGGREAEGAAAGEEHGARLVRPRPRGDHVGLAGPRAAAADVDPASRPGRRDHHRAPGRRIRVAPVTDRGTRRGGLRTRSPRLSSAAPRASGPSWPGTAPSPPQPHLAAAGRSRSSARRRRSASPAHRSAGRAAPRGCGRGTRPASRPSRRARRGSRRSRRLRRRSRPPASRRSPRAAPGGARAASSRPARAGAGGPGRAPRRRRCCRRRRGWPGSSRNDFSGAVRPAAASPSACGRELVGERLDPEPAAKRSSRASSPSRKPSPKRRGSVNQSSRPSSSVKRARRWRSSSARAGRGGDPPEGSLAVPADQDQVAGHPQVHDQGLAPVEAHQQVLAAAPQPLDRSPADRGLQDRRRQRPRPALVEDLQRLDPPPSTARARAGGGSSRPRAARASPRGYQPARTAPAACGVAAADTASRTARALSAADGARGAPGSRPP